MSEEIVYTKDGAVASLRFNRPEKKNAITGAMYRSLTEALRDADASDDVRAVGIFGSDVFTAGNDIGDFLMGGAFNENHPALQFLLTIRDFSKPVIAGVKGAAVGIGTTLLMHCDAVVAGTSARFSMPFTKLGLLPEAGSSLLFPLIAGRMRASWYLLSGEQFGAQQALEMGMVSRVTEDADVDGAVAIMCGELAELPANAVRTTKRLLKAPAAKMVAEVMDEEARLFAAALQSDEARAAFMKFMQR
ncbi:MAG TPA: enoyl-CoA hydratase-related protein [Candidatus Aquilonibacter sp.]|nr:enoyl-CoA hydratase-related protein [Candidatus Aquilonibacter sp.]